ncbi:1930_t:CDS:1, partial [Acaulospora morrowiae]
KFLVDNGYRDTVVHGWMRVIEFSMKLFSNALVNKDRWNLCKGKSVIIEGKFGHRRRHEYRVQKLIFESRMRYYSRS